MYNTVIANKKDSVSGSTSMTCPQCGSDRLYKDGLRTLSSGEQKQRFICRGCGYRFSEPLKAVRDNSESNQIGADMVKNLVTTSKMKIDADDKRLKPLPQENKGLIVKFAAYLDRNGFYKETSYLDLLIVLAKDNCNLHDPESVKQVIAAHKWKDSVKMLACYAYRQFAKMENIQWEQPRYRQKETLLICPEEKDLDSLINAAQSKTMAAFLQTLKETYADPSEILFAEWIDLKDRILYINHPVKNHLPGKNELSYRLIAMINNLPRKDKRIFPANYRSMSESFRVLRRRAAKKLQNPRLLNISFKSYRHFGGSMLAFYTNGNVLKVKAALRQRRVENTMKYIHAVENIKEEDFEETTATTSEEVRKLGKAGWTKYDEMTINGTNMHFYRKPKKFGV